MSNKSTRVVSREYAISRIKEIYEYILAKNYVSLEFNSFGERRDIDVFVKEFPEIDIDNIENFTNYMLEKILDGEFFRSSKFENYEIGIEI